MAMLGRARGSMNVHAYIRVVDMDTHICLLHTRHVEQGTGVDERTWMYMCSGYVYTHTLTRHVGQSTGVETNDRVA